MLSSVKKCNSVKVSYKFSIFTDKICKYTLTQKQKRKTQQREKNSATGKNRLKTVEVTKSETGKLKLKKNLKIKINHLEDTETKFVLILCIDTFVNV